MSVCTWGCTIILILTVCTILLSLIKFAHGNGHLVILHWICLNACEVVKVTDYIHVLDCSPHWICQALVKICWSFTLVKNWCFKLELSFASLRITMIYNILGIHWCHICVKKEAHVTVVFTMLILIKTAENTYEGRKLCQMKFHKCSVYMTIAVRLFQALVDI